MADTNTVRTEDVVSVGSRISWGALLAGAVVSMALYLVLTMLGTAIGFSIGDNAKPETLVNGALVWAIVTTALALFAGGWVATQLTAGENKCEAMIHGVILWGTVVAIMLWLAAAGMRGGFNSMLNVAYVGSAERDGRTAWEEAARRAGFSQERINEAKAALERRAEETSAKIENTTSPEAQRAAAMLTWGALFGTLLSMGAAVLGALVGAGPSRHLLWAGKPELAREAPRQYATHV